MSHTIPQGKYVPYAGITLHDRQWPNNTLTHAPRWCSVDLRDGNQALRNPMSIQQKKEFFKLLCRIGFKEIEVGFPSASQIEFDFIRQLIEEHMIPDDVTISILAPARKEHIFRSVEALQGVKQGVVHLYNSTSVAQRKIVFNKTPEEICMMAVQGVAWIQEAIAYYKTPLGLEYTPESFPGTELPFALEICNRVIQQWNAPIIINLPTTVEMGTVNRFADRVEWMSRHLLNRDTVTLSIHTHNDRNSAVASAELALLAGAQRVEGTLLGNGERTGNMDILTLALNMFSEGIETGLDFSFTPEVVRCVETWTGIPTHVRHPYVGELVYTAFSGSHQDAIHKGLIYQEAQESPLWEVPYLPIDPRDIGRNLDGIVRINAQSGKGGIRYILEQYGHTLSSQEIQNMSRIVQHQADILGRELTPDEIKSWYDFHFGTQDALKS